MKILVHFLRTISPHSISEQFRYTLWIHPSLWHTRNPDIPELLLWNRVSWIWVRSVSAPPKSAGNTCAIWLCFRWIARLVTICCWVSPSRSPDSSAWWFGTTPPLSDIARLKIPASTRLSWGCRAVPGCWRIACRTSVSWHLYVLWVIVPPVNSGSLCLGFARKWSPPIPAVCTLQYLCL